MNAVNKLLEELSHKKGISEIMINNEKGVFVEKDQRLINLDYSVPKKDCLDYLNALSKTSPFQYSQDDYFWDGILSDGSRINVVFPPAVKDFPAISIRKFVHKKLTLDKNPEAFMVYKDWGNFLKTIVQLKKNILISGGTSSGKTTFLNVLMREIDPEERIIVIEDVAELEIPSPNHVRLEQVLPGPSRRGISARDLVRNTLRMRPDRIVLGETRGAEFFDLLQALNTGHRGSLCTIHANSAREALARMENLYSMSGIAMPEQRVREEISIAFDFIIQLGRSHTGERVIIEIFELLQPNGGMYQTSSLAKFKGAGLEATGMAPHQASEYYELGLINQSLFS